MRGEALRRVPRALITAVGLGLALFALIVSGWQQAIQAEGRHVPPPFPPTVMACMQAHRHICNPTVYATLVAEDPFSRPPSAHPVYITQDQAMAAARRISAAPPTVQVHAKLMTRQALEDVSGMHTFHNQDRMLWVVSVFSDIEDRNGNIDHVYTVEIDAETGLISGIEFGRALAD